MLRGEGAARIDDEYFVTGQHRYRRQRLRDVHGTDQDDAQRRIPHLNEDVAIGCLDNAAFVVRDGAPNQRESVIAQVERPVTRVALDQQLLARRELRDKGGGLSGAA